MDNYGMKVQATVDLPSTKKVDEQIRALEKNISKLKVSGKFDDTALKNLTNQLNTLKATVATANFSPVALKELTSQVENALKNINISGVNIGNINNGAKQTGQQIGSQISQDISQGISSASRSTEKVLRDFSELNDAKRKFVDGHDLISKDDIADAEKLYDTVRKAFSEFGQVTVSKGSMNDGSLENMRVKIEQVNGEMKITRDFMLYFNESKNGFKLVDDDTIRTTEKMVQHLNEEKNIINATNEEANAIKEKLAEQEKYYGKLGQATKEQIALEKQRITAGEKQLEILEEQAKRRDSRISYNEGQIDKKGLSDVSRQRKINDLEYSGREKIDIAFGREFDKSLTSLSKLKETWQKQGIYVDEFKAKVESLEKSLNEITIGDVKGLNTFKEQISSLSFEAKQLSQIHEIQLSMTDKSEPKDNYNLQIEKQIAQLKSLGLTDDEVTAKTKVLTDAHAELKQVIESTNYNSVNDKNQAILSADEKRTTALRQVKNAYEQAKIAYDKYIQPVPNEKATSLINRINSFLTKNTKITNEAKVALQGYADELGRGVNLSRWNEINGILKKTENSMRGLGRLGASLKDQVSQAAESFTQWLSVSSVVMLLVSKIKNAITELKEVNSIMTEISKTADQLSKADLSKVENTSYKTASKYGKKASNYLTGIQEMYRAGYENAEDLAELSTLAQAAGDMQADLANDYLIATDAAYKLKGNTEALNDVLDGQNYITNRNALSMQDLAEATKIAASQSASSGIAIDQATAAMGTMIATTRQGGDVAARAWKGILMNIQQVEGEVEDGEIIDAESLSKYEKACESLGVSLKEVKDGVIFLRDPMQILKELSEAYTALDESDARRANLISAVGGKYRGNQLNALLENWSLYEKMLKDYAEGSGSALEEAMKSANNWEGSMNRLGNTFTKVVNNIVKSDAVITGANGLNSLLSIIDKITYKLGSFGTISTIGSGYAGAKGLGLTNYVTITS